jgi:hypothetical protein
MRGRLCKLSSSADRAEGWVRACGGSSTVEPRPSKAMMRVRFPSAACTATPGNQPSTSPPCASVLARAARPQGAWPPSVLNSVYRLLRAHTAPASGRCACRGRLPAVDMVLGWRKHDHRADLRACACAADPRSALARLRDGGAGPARPHPEPWRTPGAANTLGAWTPATDAPKAARRAVGGARTGSRNAGTAVLRADRRLTPRDGASR